MAGGRAAAVFVALLAGGLPLAASLRRATAPDPEPALVEHCEALRREIRATAPPRDPAVEDLQLLQLQSEEVARSTQSSPEELRGASTSGSLVGGRVDVGIAHYKEELSWVGALPKGLNLRVRPAEGVDETIAFVKQLLESYDSGANMSVYLHGSGPSDWHSPANLSRYLAVINPEKLNARLGGYASLNHPYMTNASGSQHKLLEYRVDCLWKDDKWVKMMKARWGIPAFGGFTGHASRYCCSQFVVTREALHVYPKVFYESLLERMSQKSPWAHSSWKTVGRSMAMLWHVVFTGKVDEPRYPYEAFADCPSETGCQVHKAKRAKR